MSIGTVADVLTGGRLLEVTSSIYEIDLMNAAEANAYWLI